MDLAQKAVMPLQASVPGATLLRLSLHSILADYQPFDIQPGTTWALPSHSAGPFMDNSEDYRNRYKHPNPEKYRTQMQFLQKLIALCQYNDIDVILVNMPISKRNLDLLDSAMEGEILSRRAAHGGNSRGRLPGPVRHREILTE